MEYLSLYADFVKIKLKSIVEYPGAFWMQTIAKMMGWGAGLIVLYLMINRFENVFGWTKYEVLFLHSINATSYALAGFFMWNSFQRLGENIQMGTFDEVLIKPMNPFIYICVKGFTTGYIGNLIASISALIFSMVKLNMQLSFLNVIYFIIMLFGSALVHCGLFMFFNIPVFWMIKADAFTDLKWGVQEFIRYPISIYGRWIQILLTFIMPAAFIAFYPAQYFLQKNDLLGFSPNIVHLTPVIGIIMFFLGYKFFFVGLKNYKSTGS